jgi:glycosyltransferase involved in cell wall biosynthesis
VQKKQPLEGHAVLLNALTFASMLNGKKIVVVLPAYNAAKTLQQTYNEIPFPIVDDVVLVDDRSKDETVQKAKEIGIHHIIQHQKNRGYGGNQKSCYNKALELGADIVIMLHPDYQYTPKLIPSMAHLIANDLYHVVLGSRILGKGALRGGMPFYKYIANRLLTFTQNILVGQKLSEYHTGYRAFSREVLEKVNYEADSDDFVFDNEMLSQIIYLGYEMLKLLVQQNILKKLPASISKEVLFMASVCSGFLWFIACANGGYLTKNVSA